MLDGDLDPVVQSALDADEAAKLAALADDGSPRVTDLRDGVRAAAARLRDAGVASADVDAVELAAHVLGVDAAEVRRLMVLGGRTLPGRRMPSSSTSAPAGFRCSTSRAGPTSAG